MSGMAQKLFTIGKHPIAIWDAWVFSEVAL